MLVAATTGRSRKGWERKRCMRIDPIHSSACADETCLSDSQAGIRCPFATAPEIRSIVAWGSVLSYFLQLCVLWSRGSEALFQAFATEQLEITTHSSCSTAATNDPKSCKITRTVDNYTI